MKYTEKVQNKKFRRVQEAYEQLQKERGFLKT